MTVLSALRDAAWLTRARARGYSAILAVVLAAAALMVGHARYSHDAATRPDATDFLPFYAAGIMAGEGRGQDAYDIHAIAHVEARYADLGHGLMPFMYPPVLLVVCGWIARLPQAWAYAIFELLGLIPLLATLRRFLPTRWAVLPLILCPAFLMNAGSGQTGFLVAACFAGAMALVARRPGLAGMCLGVLVIKPHFALLVPFALVASRRWRVLASCGATAAGLCGLSAWILGVPSWMQFVLQAGVARRVLEHSSTAMLVISPFGAVHALGGSALLGYVLQAICASACLVAIVISARKRAAPESQVALLAAAALCTTPYGMDYDLVISMVPLVWLIAQATGGTWHPWEKLVLCLVYVLPLFSRVLVLETRCQLAPLVLGALFYVTWRRGMAFAGGHHAVERCVDDVNLTRYPARLTNCVADVAGAQHRQGASPGCRVWDWCGFRELPFPRFVLNTPETGLHLCRNG